jgi:FtsP/CotA-like multicopper oxidase with cupredoxin domain
MKQSVLVASLVLSFQTISQNPMAVPQALTGTDFNLNLQTGSVQFFPGQATQTMGVNGSILAPTLIVEQGQTVTFNVTNDLGEETTIHWHGMHVSPANDGGPHTTIPAGTTWSPVIPVLDWASTYWYHPHLHHKTHEHVQKGIAGFIIVRDDIEGALTLPRIYGVDDFPIAVQTKAIDANNQIVVESELDTALFVNGTYKAYLDAPAQMVRLRLLNGSSMRYYNFGFSNNMIFHQIGSDGGLLTAPVAHTRLMMAPGERAEILVNLEALQNQTIYLMNYGAQLENGIYGAAQPGMGAGQQIPGYNLNPLNGANFNVLQINVVAPTPNAITTLPASLVTHQPWSPTDANTTRELVFTSTTMGPTGINGPFVINGMPFDMMMINYEIPFENIEIWELRNQSPIAHPFHIHDVQFYVLSINGVAPPPHLAGRKDVIHVPGGNTVVRFITQFETFYDDHIPYMYHCHMLIHEDDGMMGQFLVKSPCALQIVSQPLSVQSLVGETVQFTVDASSAESIDYQWQTDIGFGWQNLSNAGQYSGVNTETLTVSNTSLANNNQIFRCQVKISDNCISNTQSALLEVGTSGVYEQNNKLVLIYPNPSESTFNISSNETILSIQVVDVFGRIVYEAKPSNNLAQIDAIDWASGTYLMIIDGIVQHRLMKSN